MDRMDPQTSGRSYLDPGHTAERDAFPPATPTGTTGDTLDGGLTGGTGTAGGFDPWRYRDETAVSGRNLVGYKVEATDGGIGKVDRASHEVDSSYLVVDTGPWIFGKKVLLPAGTVNHVDHEDEKVYVDRSKDQIKAAPEFDEDTHADPAYRDKISGYYGDTYGTTGSEYRSDRAI